MIVPSLEQLADIVAVARNAIDRLSEQPRLAIYGTGFLGQWAARWLPENGHDLAACYDSNPQKIGTRFGSLDVRAASDVRGDQIDLTLVTARHAVRPVSTLLTEMGVAHLPFEAFFIAQQFEAFRAVHALLADERSREVLRAVLAAMLTGDTRLCEAVFERDQYFCLPRFCGAEKEIFIDAGAYVGDSVERFLWTHFGVFDAIHAFEPGARQYDAFAARMARLSTEWALEPASVSLNRSALGATESTMAGDSHSGQLQSLSLQASGPGDGVPVVPLDAYLAGGRATFIKADVEGMEMALLEGARETITRHRPKLAICVYHYPSDIPDITGYIRSLVPDYQFALRHHSPQLMETVLYAWVD